MAISQNEIDAYFAIVGLTVSQLRCLPVDENEILWHYTTGQNLINIIESGSLWTTQVSCLNDSTEVLYATDLLFRAFRELSPDANEDPDIQEFTRRLSAIPDDPSAMLSSYISSRWFVACFSSVRDDLSQWRAYGQPDNAYAIGFLARGLINLENRWHLYKVNYDLVDHNNAARKIAAETVHLFRHGLASTVERETTQFASEFLPAWLEALNYLAPIVKNPAFAPEREYRIVKGLLPEECRKLQFRQKATMMRRHLPLIFEQQVERTPPTLPIYQVLIGPGRHQHSTRVSLESLLTKNGYPPGLTASSTIPFQAI